MRSINQYRTTATAAAKQARQMQFFTSAKRPDDSKTRRVFQDSRLEEVTLWTCCSGPFWPLREEKPCLTTCVCVCVCFIPSSHHFLFPP